MRKYFLGLISLLMISFLVIPVTAKISNANSVFNPFIFVNDDLAIERVELKNGKTFVDVNFFRNYLGAEVIAGDEITIVKDTTLTLNTKDSYFQVNSGGKATLDLLLKNNKIYVPLTLVKYFGYEVSYPRDTTVLRVRNKSAQLTDKVLFDYYKDYIELELKMFDEERLEAAKKLEEQKKQEEAEKAAQSKSDKVVYLTFDDGPNSKYTPQILDALKKYNMKATFFMLNGNMNQNKTLVERAVKEGHVIGLHGVTHSMKKVYASRYSVLNEMNANNNTLNSILGYKTKLVRVPYGSKPHMKREQLTALESSGYRMWDWNIDSGDTKKACVPSNKIYSDTITEIKKHKTSVVLFHDKKTTAEALPRILEFLKKNNYDVRILTPDMKPLNFWN
jgi:peptidoglycan-N-acetylglucosamine deacetylase